MQIKTRRFGTISVEAEEIFHVPEGIPGFTSIRRVVMFAAAATSAKDAEYDGHTMFWMQDVDNADVSFLCLVPWEVFPTYDIEVDETEFGIVDDSDVRIMNLITIRRSPEGMTLTANLRAPLLIDVRQRMLRQVILSDTRWSINELIASRSMPGAK